MENVLRSSLWSAWSFSKAPFATASSNHRTMKSLFAENISRVIPCSSSSLRTVRHCALSSRDNESTVRVLITEPSVRPSRNSRSRSLSFCSTRACGVHKNAVNMLICEVNRLRISPMSSECHRIRSQVRFDCWPRLSYLWTIPSRCSRTSWHPLMMILSLSARYGGGVDPAKVSSHSFRTACRDCNSYEIL